MACSDFLHHQAVSPLLLAWVKAFLPGQRLTLTPLPLPVISVSFLTYITTNQPHLYTDQFLKKK